LCSCVFSAEVSRQQAPTSKVKPYLNPRVPLAKIEKLGSIIFFVSGIVPHNHGTI
jgi:hypothetical protein